MPTKNKSLPKVDDTPTKGTIVPTDSWLNRKDNAVYVNIPEKDVVLIVGTDGKKRLSFITSVNSLARIVNGEIKGTNLGKFSE